VQPQPQLQPQQSRHYSCSVTRGPAGFGINIEDDALGNAVVGGVTGQSAQQEGVKVGSIFMVVGGMAVTGMGRAGVVAALQQPHIASQLTVDFIFDAPAPNAAISWG
jgi:C-terminal processing protease CtpA/Prc